VVRGGDPAVVEGLQVHGQVVNPLRIQELRNEKGKYQHCASKKRTKKKKGEWKPAFWMT
jgi:hypothetical protein